MGPIKETLIGGIGADQNERKRDLTTRARAGVKANNLTPRPHSYPAFAEWASGIR